MLFLALATVFSPAYEDVERLQQEMVTTEERSATLFELSLAHLKDQELDRAFSHFLAALRFQGEGEAVSPTPEDEEAFATYLSLAGQDPLVRARTLIETYGACDSPHCRLLIATAHGNLGEYKPFFERFYAVYPEVRGHFLADKTCGILYLRLARHCPNTGGYLELAQEHLRLAFEKNPHDGGLYKTLLFLAETKGEKHRLLEQFVDSEAVMGRGEVGAYVEEALQVGDPALAQRIIDKGRQLYEYSRSISNAQEYLNRQVEGWNNRP